MTIEDLIGWIAGADPVIVLALFLTPPMLAGLMGALKRDDPYNRTPWRYVYALLVYWVSLPGILACLLTGYALFFVRQNLLQVNVVVYFLPILAMVVTLVLIRRQVIWDDLPGVERLFAFITLIAVTFLIVLALVKLRIWVVFGGSMITLLIIAVICYVVLKASFNRLTGKKSVRYRYR